MPHTKQQLQVFLEQAGIRPRHQWGQNFLIDLNLMHLIVDQAGIEPAQTILEVGCATGSLTGLLAQQAGRVVAVDIDPHLIKVAREELREQEHVQFIHADVLASKHVIAAEVLQALPQKPDETYRLVANLPYQVACPLIMNLLVLKHPPDGMVVTVQEEVALRMVAEPGSKEYGSLSILLQICGQGKIIRKLPARAFWPEPQVHSAIYAWQPHESDTPNRRERLALQELVELLLGQRRKTIRSLLSRKYPADMVDRLLRNQQLEPDRRAETLTPAQFLTLSRALK